MPCSGARSATKRATTSSRKAAGPIPSDASDRPSSPNRYKAMHRRSKSGSGEQEATQDAGKRASSRKRAATKVEDTATPVERSTSTTRQRGRPRSKATAAEPSGPVESLRPAGGKETLSIPEAASAGRAKDGATPSRQSAVGKVQMVPRLSVLHNTLNAILMVAVALPALLYGWAVATGWGAPVDAQALAEGGIRPLSIAWWLAIGYHK